MSDAAMIARLLRELQEKDRELARRDDHILDLTRERDMLVTKVADLQAAVAPDMSGFRLYPPPYPQPAAETKRHPAVILAFPGRHP